jgi:predicted RNase H-like HicB family nuclease
MTTVRVIVQQTGRGFAATVPALPGINAQGETEALAISEASRLVRERLAAREYDASMLPGRSVLLDLDTGRVT